MSKHHYDIRQLSEKEIPEYSLLWIESRRLNPDIFAEGVDDDIQVVRRNIRRELKRKAGKVIFGCESRGEIIGIGEFEREERLNRNHRASVSGIYVKESFRRNGIGTKIFDEIIKYARSQKDLEQIELGITVDPHRRLIADGTTERKLEVCRQRGFRQYVVHPAWMRTNGRDMDAYFLGLNLVEPPPANPGEKPKKHRACPENDPDGDLVHSPKERNKIILPDPGVILRLENKDAKDYKDLRAEARRLHPDIFADSYMEEIRRSLEEVREEMGGKTVFAYYLDQEIIGIAEFFLETNENKRHRAHLAGMYVKESFRGKILGRPVSPDQQLVKIPPKLKKGSGGQKHVDESLRGKGCASALVDAVIEHARHTGGVKQLELGVVAANANAIKLYANKGFRTMGAHPNWMKIYGDNIHVHFMVLPIGREGGTAVEHDAATDIDKEEKKL